MKVTSCLGGENSRTILGGAVLRFPHGVCVPVPFTKHLENLLTSEFCPVFPPSETKSSLLSSGGESFQARISLPWDAHVSFWVFDLRKGVGVHSFVRGGERLDSPHGGGGHTHSAAQGGRSGS